MLGMQKIDECFWVRVVHPCLEHVRIVLYHVYAAIECWSLVREVGEVCVRDAGDIWPSLSD